MKSRSRSEFDSFFIIPEFTVLFLWFLSLYDL